MARGNHEQTFVIQPEDVLPRDFGNEHQITVLIGRSESAFGAIGQHGPDLRSRERFVLFLRVQHQLPAHDGLVRRDTELGTGERQGHHRGEDHGR